MSRRLFDPAEFFAANAVYSFGKSNLGAGGRGGEGAGRRVGKSGLLHDFDAELVHVSPTAAAMSSKCEP